MDNVAQVVPNMYTPKDIADLHFSTAQNAQFPRHGKGRERKQLLAPRTLELDEVYSLELEASGTCTTGHEGDSTWTVGLDFSVSIYFPIEVIPDLTALVELWTDIVVSVHGTLEEPQGLNTTEGT